MKELTEFQKRLLRSFDEVRNVHFRYNIVDCENNGDIVAAVNKVESFLKSYDGRLIDSYWDGKDCGEAWIVCVVPPDRVAEVLETGFFEYDPWQ